MKLNNMLPRTPYEGCLSSATDAGIILFGAGFDGTSSYRPGSRFAPAAIRAETLYSQENYSPYFRKDLSEKAIHDAGDLDLPFGNKGNALAMIEETIKQIVQKGKKPCMIGGEHLVTLAAVKAMLPAYPGLCIVQIDAHLDLMDELFGESLSHGTVMRRCCDLIGEKQRIFQGAIRSGSPEEYAFAEQHTRLFQFDCKGLIAALPELKGRPVYLTIDLDGFDPSLIPGTGTPEAGGIFFAEFIEFLQAASELNIVGCDLVELAPRIDPTNNSTIIAAKILRELLMIL